MDVAYAVEAGLGVEEFEAVLRESGLGERRPVDDRDRLEKTLRGAGFIVTARLEGRLVGVARSVTDWSYCLYLSDLAVSRDAQRARDWAGIDRADAGRGGADGERAAGGGPGGGHLL